MIVSNYSFVIERYANKTNDKYFNAIFPMYYDPYNMEPGNAIASKFNDQSYEFRFQNNGTILEIGKGNITYTNINDRYHLANIEENCDNFPFIMSKLVLDGFIDSFCKSLSLDFVYQNPDSNLFDKVEIKWTKVYGDSYKIEKKQIIFKIFNPLWMFFYAIWCTFWMWRAARNVLKEFRRLCKKIRIYNLWFRLEIGLDFNDFMLKQRNLKSPEFMRLFFY